MESTDTMESNNEESTITPKYPMISFEKQIFADLFEKDALLIMAK